MQTIKAIVTNVFVYSSGHYLIAKTKSENRPWAAAAEPEPEHSIVVAGGVRAGISKHKHAQTRAQAETETDIAGSQQEVGPDVAATVAVAVTVAVFFVLFLLLQRSLCFCLAYKTRGVPLPLCKRAGRQLNRSCSSSSIVSFRIAIGFTLVNSFSDLVIPHSASQLGGGGNVEAGRAQTCLPHHHQQLDHSTQQYQ